MLSLCLLFLYGYVGGPLTITTDDPTFNWASKSKHIGNPYNLIAIITVHFPKQQKTVPDRTGITKVKLQNGADRMQYKSTLSYYAILHWRNIVCFCSINTGTHKNTKLQTEQLHHSFSQDIKSVVCAETYLMIFILYKCKTKINYLKMILKEYQFKWLTKMPMAAVKLSAGKSGSPRLADSWEQRVVANDKSWEILKRNK